MIGSAMDVSDVLDVVLEDRAYYENSGGGVTFSGGESLLSFEFLYSLLRESRRMGIHCAVDTAGNVPWSEMAAILPMTDLLLYDLKHVDPDPHRQMVGAGTDRTLRNLERAASLHDRVWVRIPVVPGFNADVETLTRMAEYLSGLPPTERVELLPFHRLGEEKYQSLDLTCRTPDVKPPTEDEMSGYRELFRQRGLSVT